MMLFSFDDQPELYSSSVDCTLSLGTPSTRLTTQDDRIQIHQQHRRSGPSYVPNFCWDLLHSKHSPSVNHSHKTDRGDSISSNDSLLARRCANCDTTSTPLWRNGPRGPKSLCNACGIRFKKEERRATAAAASTTTTTTGSALTEQHHMFSYQNNSWAQTPKTAYISPGSIGNEFRLVDEDSRESDNGISFLSWRLNVTDRPSLVNDFTR